MRAGLLVDRRAVIGGALALIGAASCQTGPTGAGDPLFVLEGQNPWRLVLGSEAPTFALYDDGSVIYERGDGFKSVQLSSEELKHLVAALGLAELPKFAKHYEVVGQTDANTHTFYVFNGAKISVISVYGELRVRAVEIDGKPVDKLISMVPEPLVAA